MEMVVSPSNVWHYVGGTLGSSLCLFWRETKQRPELEISDKTRSGGEKTSWQRNPERGSWRRETQRGSRKRTVEGISQDELAFQCGQRLAEGGNEEDGQRWVGIPSGFYRSFAKNTLPAIVYKMHEKLYKKVSQNYPSCTWSWPKSILFVCFFFLPLPRLYFLWP